MVTRRLSDSWSMHDKARRLILQRRLPLSHPKKRVFSTDIAARPRCFASCGAVVLRSFGLAVLCFATVCDCHDANPRIQSAGTARLRAIADASTRDTDLIRAIHSLGAVNEPASFWTAIIGNPEFSSTHRRRCLFAFFRRHAYAGITLNELLQVGSVGEWFDDDQIVDMTHASKVPVSRVGRGSIYAFRPELPSSNDSAVYLRFSVTISKEELISVLCAKVVRRPEVRIEETGCAEFED